MNGGQGFTGFLHGGAGTQQPRDQLILCDVWLVLTGGGIGGIPYKIQPRDPQSLFIDGIKVERIALGGMRHADDGKMLPQLPTVAEGKREVTGHNGDFAGVGKVKIQRAAHVKVFCTVGDGCAHFFVLLCSIFRFCSLQYLLGMVQ